MAVRPQKRLFAALLVVAFIMAVCFSSPFQFLFNLPRYSVLFARETMPIKVPFPFTATLTPTPPTSLSPSTIAASKLNGAEIQPQMLIFKLLDLIPIRTVKIDVLPEVKVVPGGQSIGATLHAKGIMVVGMSPVLSADGKYTTPAKDAGIQIGDVIMSINDIPMCTETQVADTIESNGKAPVTIKIQRNSELITVSTTPIMCRETNRYRIGLFVRDGTAGVGTLTFYEPNSLTYGALGHSMNDSDTNQPFDVETGDIRPSVISGIQVGKRGQPGEKLGIVATDNSNLGEIIKNTELGIYGKLTQLPDNGVFSEAIPVASHMEVKPGYAEMLTVTSGQKVERYSIEIVRVNVQSEPSGKGLVIEVTDPRLLSTTGGIVQGMSGSPIIQNGKLVGAVTHVQITNPRKGFGCFADWMLMESDLLPKNKRQTLQKPFAFLF